MKIQLVQKLHRFVWGGGRSIKRVVPYYNLDMIISVGYMSIPLAAHAFANGIADDA
ncbi:hypothetical protein SAMN05720470_101311 [Fibrobacter sp. UWOV1]|nr:hypothetical protein SAMN05720470_101311 [Fibrobacter sp. UWOV1]